VTRVARWSIFRPKIAVWVNFGGTCWSILRPFGLFYGHLICICYGHLVYFVVIWYTFPTIGILHQEKSGNAESDRVLQTLKLSRILGASVAVEPFQCQPVCHAHTHVRTNARARANALVNLSMRKRC
jgi:hypothetical protein